ncbi:MAG: 3-isopropylmalate dehydrogenase [Planctomycetota bacterium]
MKVVVLPGDGIGPEVTSAAVAVCKAAVGDADLSWQDCPFGYSAVLSHGAPFPDETREACLASDAVLLGAAGTPDDAPPGSPRAEAGLLDLRKTLGTWANLRPVSLHPSLKEASPLKSDRLEGVDLFFVRELTGGMYFGEKQKTDDMASDLCIYTRPEVERVVRKACQIAMTRSKRVTSVDKANVLESSRLWRRVAIEVVEKEFPDITLEHVLVDAMAMHLLNRPADFDVVVTENMFGDILTDEASMLPGSMGMLPSASVGDGSRGLYEPIHGSAPDIAGKGVANPYAAILSAAMMLRLSRARATQAAPIESAVHNCVTDGISTPDLGGSASTTEVTDAVISRL